MSNKKKDALLGEPHGTAANRLRKKVLFAYVKLAGHDNCFRCERKIETVVDFSIEHKAPWQAAKDPVASFFDLSNVAFSHLSCNSSAKSSPNKKYFSVEARKDALRIMNAERGRRVYTTERRRAKYSRSGY